MTRSCLLLSADKSASWRILCNCWQKVFFVCTIWRDGIYRIQALPDFYETSWKQTWQSNFNPDENVACVSSSRWLLIWTLLLSFLWFTHLHYMLCIVTIVFFQNLHICHTMEADRVMSFQLRRKLCFCPSDLMGSCYHCFQTFAPAS